MTLPVRSPAQGTWILRPLAEHDGPTLLDDGDPESLRAAVAQSLAWLDRQPPGRGLTFGPRRVTIAEYSAGLRRLLMLLAGNPAPEVLEERVLAEFDVLSSVGRPDGAVLLTGYHEPVVEASDRQSPAYPIPILGLPVNFTGGWRYPRFLSRAEIEAGRLGAAARPLAWARDPVDVFFMEVEGSGTLRFPGGREVRVGPAATNGYPYRSIGRLLIDEGRLTDENISMHAIRSWLAENPAERARVLRHNQSVVFFRRLDGPPTGSLGVPLTPVRSIATDARLFPAGSLAFVRTERPVRLADGRIGWSPLSRFVLNQDTGGAIRGPGRVDLFWGRGHEAELAASEMKQLGELYFLVPKPSRRVAAGASLS
ncbi:MAG TPA: MltA domain-containing protein [Methylomirabilota bacterium]|nr:MltA domain-containing protein [Methylomirabilota bacterium]